MIVVWRGYGILVLVVAAVAVFIAAAIVDVAHLKPPFIAIVYTVAEIVAGAGIWYFAKWREAKPGRVLIDKATGREFTVKPTAGHLFFIPTRYWAFIIPGLVLVLDVSVLLKDRA
jgi:hypothetical protein